MDEYEMDEDLYVQEELDKLMKSNCKQENCMGTDAQLCTTCFAYYLELLEVAKLVECIKKLDTKKQDQIMTTLLKTSKKKERWQK